MPPFASASSLDDDRLRRTARQRACGVRSFVVAAAAALTLFTALFSATGCSTYAHKVSKIRTAYYAGQLEQAHKMVDEGLKHGSGDADVLKLERAMILLSSGKPQEAERTLREVRDHFDSLDGPNIASKSLSYLTDDQRRAYAGEDYEKVLVRALLAMSNLLHDGGDAEAYSLQMIDKQEQIIAGGKNQKGENPKAGYERVAIAPYLRGVLREATHRDYDDAQRAYATVVSWQPSFLPGKSDVQRAEFGHHSEPGNGVLYVFALTGRGPYKEEVVEVPTSAALLIAGDLISVLGDQTVPPNIAPVKVPRVVARPRQSQSVGVVVDGRSAGQTQTITDISQLAVNQYNAIFQQVVARAVARRCVKKGVVYGAKEMSGMAKGSLAGFAVDMAGVAWEATESADTRCWGLLPDKIQVLRIELPVGEHSISLIPYNGGANTMSAVNQKVVIADARNTYMLATCPDSRFVGQIVVKQQ